MEDKFGIKDDYDDKTSWGKLEEKLKKGMKREEFEDESKSLICRTFTCKLCWEEFTDFKEHSKKHLGQKIPFLVHGFEMFVRKEK